MFSEESWNAYLKLASERPAEFAQDQALEIVFDRDVVASFANRTGSTIGVAYRSNYNILIVDLVRDGAGRLFPYERLLPASTGTSVVVVPILQGDFILLDQFRHSLRSRQYAFPRGYGEDGLSATENAKKELREELGACALSTRTVGNVIANSGISGDEAAVVLCDISDCEFKPGYEEIAGMLRLSAGKLMRWIAEGQISDGFTLSAWALLQAESRLKEDGTHYKER